MGREEVVLLWGDSAMSIARGVSTLSSEHLVMVGLLAALVVVVAAWKRRRPGDAVCGCPEWTMRRAEARGAEFAQRVLAALFEPMATQIGGMQHVNAKRGMMSLRREAEAPDRLIEEPVPLLKAMQSRRRGEREVSFYEAMTYADAKWGGKAKGSSFEAQYGLLREFVCGYHGVVKLAESEVRDRGSYIVLNDVTAGIGRPNVLDVKMGTQTYEPDVAKDRSKRELAKYPEQSELGMRVVGMRCWPSGSKDPGDDDVCQVHDKSWGLSLKSHAALLNGFSLFFGLDCSSDEKVVTQRCRRVVADFESRCRRLLDWFEHTNRDLVFISSSLLFVYDVRSDDIPPRIELRMIDFTHVRRDGKRDVGYILGLKRLVRILAELQTDGAKFSRPNKHQP